MELLLICGIVAVAAVAFTDAPGEDASRKTTLLHL